MTWNTSLIDGPIIIPVLGEPDSEGVREVLGTVPGYHLNIAPEIASGLEAYTITPNTPTQVFAGSATVFLQFTNEAQARSVLGQYWISQGE